MDRVILDSFVKILKVIDRGLLADNGELGSIHSVPFAHAVSLGIDHLRKFLQHAVSEGITVNVVQAREFVDADKHNLNAFALPLRRLQILKESVQASEIRDVVKITQGIVILDGSAKIIRLAILIANHHAATGADNILAILGTGAILQIMFADFSTKQLFNACRVNSPIVRMNILHPDIPGIFHILARQAEIIYRFL